MIELEHPVEKLVQTIIYKGAEFDVVERPDVLWVGCVNYAANNTDEPDIGVTLKRYREDLGNVSKNKLIKTDCSAALSINYTLNGKAPKGIMFAQETYSAEQDERYDLFTQPAGLWLRVLNDKNAAALLGKDSAEPYECFELLRNAAKENGYLQNPDIHVEVEYYRNTPVYTTFVYIPIIKT